MSIIKKILKKIWKPTINLCCDFLMLPAKRHKGRILFNSEELKLVHQALLSQNLFSIDGKMVPDFEKEFASAYGIPYSVASSSGTAAIHTALGALDLNPGDEVITAPITDAGTIIPILLQNAIPVFADIDETYNMDPADVERKITPRTRAIIVVHLFGNPCDMDAIVKIAKKSNIPIIEDCAQAHMTEYKGKYVGTIGDIGCFSFQQSKHMTTGEGGMTITSNKAYYEKMKFFVDKGYARKGWGPRSYLFLSPNYRPTEMIGAIGLAQLKKVNAVVKKRQELGGYLSHLILQIEGVHPAPITSGAQHSYWLYPMRLEKSIDLNLFAQEMIKEKVWVSAGYTGKPIYLCTEALTEKKTYGQSQCPFSCKNVKINYEYKEGLCPHAEDALRHLICIPLDESLEKKDIKRIADTIAKCMSTLTQEKGSVISIETIKEKSIVSTPIPKPKDSKKIRIGIVGCGQMGQWHLDSYKMHPQVELVAFADTDFDKAQNFARELGAHSYHSHKEMIENERLDGVSLCTVPSTHKEIALDLLDAGINVLCEKPLAISTVQAQEMVNRAKQKNLLILTAFKFRFFDEVLKTKELIEKGSLGNILTFRLMFAGYMDMSGKWYSEKKISGGGVIIDNGIHAVDLIRYLFGEVYTVSAQKNNYQNIEVEDTAKLILCMKNSTIGTVDLSWSTSVPPQTYLEIYGEDGTALLDIQGVSYKFKTWNDWKRSPNKIIQKEIFARQTNHFVDAILKGNPSIVVNEDGLKSQMIIDAAYESIMLDRKVKI